MTRQADSPARQSGRKSRPVHDSKLRNSPRTRLGPQNTFDFPPCRLARAFLPGLSEANDSFGVAFRPADQDAEPSPTEPNSAAAQIETDSACRPPPGKNPRRGFLIRTEGAML